MNRLALLALPLAVVAGCSKKKADDAKPASSKTVAGAKALSEGTTCPIPKPDGITARFAVGASPDYRVPDYRSDHGMLCHDDFKPNDVVKVEGDKTTLVAEGTFEGGCKESPGPRTFQAIKPAKLAIEVNAMQTDEGKLGVNEPVFLDSKTPDKHAGVIANIVDRCGETLSTGVSQPSVTWTGGEGCDKVVKIAPFDVVNPPNPKSDQMQLFPVGAGTCTVKAEWLGVTGEVTVTVK